RRKCAPSATAPRRAVDPTMTATATACRLKGAARAHFRTKAAVSWSAQSTMTGAKRSRVCFFFQAEDGIRCRNVTGVQTCALPICRVPRDADRRLADQRPLELGEEFVLLRLVEFARGLRKQRVRVRVAVARSEERRVGKEWGGRWCRAAWRAKASVQEFSIRLETVQ